jgi:hypothetical protein
VTTIPDPAERLARIREMFAAEQTKLPRVDANGYPLPPEPEQDESGPDGAAPQSRAPGRNPAIGSSANGDPWTIDGDPASGELPPPPDPRNSVGVRPEVARLRDLMRHDEWRRDQQRRAAHAQALADRARVHSQQRR